MVATAIIAGFAFVYAGQLERERAVQSQALKSDALAIVSEVSLQVKAMQATVDVLAGEVVVKGSLLTVQDREKAEEQLNKNDIKGLIVARVLEPNPLNVDASSAARMDYADLEMVRSLGAVEEKVLAEFHLQGKKGGHIALVSAIRRQDKLYGVVLASFDMKVIRKLFERPLQVGEAARFELKQGPLLVMEGGGKAFGKSETLYSFRLNRASWRLEVSRPLIDLPLLQTDVVLYLLLSWLFILLSSLLGAYLSKEVKMEFLNGLLGINESRFAKEQELEAEGRIDEAGVGGDYAVDISDKFIGAEEKELRSSGAPFQHDIKVERVVPAAIFRAYDIRGIVDETLTEEGVYQIGRAIGSEILQAGQTGAVVARDGRLHSERLGLSLIKGLQATGCNVVNIGEVPTPVLYYATHNLAVNSGVMVTGSHNPADYNGLKVVIDGVTLAGDAILNLSRRIEENHFAEAEAEYQDYKILPEYLAEISDDIALGGAMKVVVDCGNGVAGEAAPQLLAMLGCEVVPLYCEIDGNFPNHHPDPSKPENLQPLIDKVKEEEAELGLAFDGDGDRLGVVDSAGNIIWPDRQLMLYAIDVLSRQAGADIVFDVKCSKNVEKVIVAHGGRPVMSKTGHSLMKARMKQVGAELGGEMSGHIFFKERWYGFDDALYAAARLLEVLTADFRSTEEIFADLPSSLCTPELTVTLAEAENFSFMERLLELANFDNAKLITIDGLRVEFPDGWGLVRASNTTPSLVLRFEADTAEAMERIQADFRQQMVSVKPGIDLPF